jgi:hypothetical protein
VASSTGRCSSWVDSRLSQSILPSDSTGHDNVVFRRITGLVSSRLPAGWHAVALHHLVAVLGAVDFLGGATLLGCGILRAAEVWPPELHHA